MNLWDTTQTWFQDNGILILTVVLSAYIINRFGTMLLEAVIRRTVGGLKNDLSEDDIKKRQDTLISMFSTLLKVLVWMVAGFTVLRRFGIDLTPLLAGASVLGVALGFGAQSLIKDFFAGLFIILENQYRVGDIVDLGGSIGSVEQITIRSTTVRDFDGNVHYIPNGSIAKVVNKTMGFSKVNISISVAPDTNVDKLAETINHVGEKMSQEDKWKARIIEPPHFVTINNFTDTALEIKINGKTQPSAQWAVTGELRRRLLTAFKKHKIDLA